MTPRLFLHVGPPKTGTSYLQGLLDANREQLREAGVDLVGTHAEHFRAANELMGRPGRRGESVPEGAVAHIRELLVGSSGTAVASCERYSMLDDAEATRLAAAFDSHELHIVVTLRDAVQVLPSQWQEHVKNGADLGWQEFCARIVDEPKYRARLTRVRRVLRSWPAAVPVARIHVVTVPPPGGPRTELRDRFCQVLGIEPTALDNDPGAANESVDLVGAELVRRLNEEAPVSPQVQHAEIKEFLVPEVLARKKAGPAPRLVGAAFDAARAESEQHVVLVRRGGFPVVGNLDDLVAATAPDTDPEEQQVDDADVADLAVASVAALARRSFERSEDDRPGRVRAFAARVRRALTRVARRPTRRRP